MAVSRKSQYALNALIELARMYYRDRPIGAARIASVKKIPKRFLEIILHQLRSAGLVISTLGRNGGYKLARRPDKITAGDIIRCIEGPSYPVDCMEDDGCNECNCELKEMWSEAQNSLDNVYNSRTLADLINPLNAE